MDEFDFVVVGSGAGGGVVASRVASAGYRVLIIEAGGDDQPPEYTVPAFHALSTEHGEMAWKFYVQHYTDDERQARDKVNFLKDESVDNLSRTGIFYPRAGTLGGCTAHHAMIFVAPQNSDWNNLASLTGDRSWNASNMRRYFERIEHCGYLRRPWQRWLNWGRHGFDGWLPTTTADPTLLMRDPVAARLVLAAAQTCFERSVWNAQSFGQRFQSWAASFLDPSDWRNVGLLHRGLNWLGSFLDPNDWRRLRDGLEGPVFTPLTIRNGRRFGTRELIRETARLRPDLLTVKLHALATRVVLDDNWRAVGVEYIQQPHAYRADPRSASGEMPELQFVRAKREVILAGGTFNTPQLLMLSGIGPPEELRKLPLKRTLVRRGVGKNLQDRYEIGVVHKMKRSFTLLRHATLEPEGPEYAEFLNGHGLYTTNGALLSIIKRSNLAQPDPDLYIFAIPGFFAGYRPEYSKRGREKNNFTWVILKAHTSNAGGHVVLRSSDPRETPIINFRSFDDDDARGRDQADDADAVVAGIEFVRTITARTAGLFDEVIPGPSVQARSQLTQYVKDHAWGHHACGTCKIGADNDPSAVLDSRFRVRGTKALRVVDASVFPKIPGFFILSAIYMIAEKAGDAILEDARRGG